MIVSYLARWTRLRAWSLAMALTATFRWASSRTLWEKYLILCFYLLGEYFEISMTNWISQLSQKERKWMSLTCRHKESSLKCHQELRALHPSTGLVGKEQSLFRRAWNQLCHHYKFHVILIFLGQHKFCLFWYDLNLPSLFVRSAMRRERPSKFSAGRITCQSWFQFS